MNYLKKLYTLNLIAFSGYGVFGYCLFLLISAYIAANVNYFLLTLVSSSYTYYHIFAYRKYIIIPILIEIILNFVLHKFFKRNISLNIKNNKYDFLFRLGLMLFFTPAIIFVLLAIYIFMDIILILSEIMRNNLGSKIILALYYYYSFKLLAKYVFFRK